jgi:hypothetical protein
MERVGSRPAPKAASFLLLTVPDPTAPRRLFARPRFSTTADREVLFARFFVVESPTAFLVFYQPTPGRAASEERGYATPPTRCVSFVVI